MKNEMTMKMYRYASIGFKNLLSLCFVEKPVDQLTFTLD